MELYRTLLITALFTTSCALHAAPVPCSVPGYDRLRAAGGDWQMEAGEVLLSELSCTACHGQGASQKIAPAWKTGPDLSAAGDRLRAAYVRAFLADPASVKPGTTMPDLLTGMETPEKEQLIEDLTHYLMGQRAKKKSITEPVVGSPKTGRGLFLSLGCVACHGPQPMERMGEKYAPGALARFLMSPLAVRPSGRMPDQKLGKKDAAHLAAYLSEGGPTVDDKFTVDEVRAQRGRKAFLSLGCVACHGRGQEIKPHPLADVSVGCLATEPKAGVPRYPLTDEQRGAIRAALEARSKNAGAEDPKVVIQRMMLQRNCFACHARAGMGGPVPAAAVHFTSTKDDLGDLGRLPPPLDGVGRKFQPAALENVLRGRDPVRSYMRVRMPGFGDEFARTLSKLLASADADPKELPVVASKNPDLAGRSEWGRELVGIKGYACIACHNINGQASLGIGAYDLAEMPKRLRPEWMRDFLLNPAAYPTGTRMPSFWPGGQAVIADRCGGTSGRQIASIRLYLTELDESLPPEGIASRATLVLKPTDRPIIFRTFLKGAGTHAIAIGFPGGVNAAFDALAVRWSMAWRGGFLDADGTWNQRYVKMEQPLGEELVRLEETGRLSIARHDELKPIFRGYRVNKEGVPVFDYDLGVLRIEDRVEPTANRGLKRTLLISGQTTEVVQFRANPPAGVKVQIAEGAALPRELEFREGVAELVEEITW